MNRPAEGDVSTNRNPSIRALASQVVRLLEAKGQKLVLAESCTGGLVAASLATVPGVSRFLCGSAVTYREDTKICWLGVPDELLRRCTAVSQEVTCCMTIHVLQRTPEANLAAAVTGYLGPDSPEHCDGLYFVAVSHRIPGNGSLEIASSETGRLDAADRSSRQEQAVGKVLELLCRYLTTAPDIESRRVASGDDG
jgi:nicotinamide-nucleotide amidase